MDSKETKRVDVELLKDNGQTIKEWLDVNSAQIFDIGIETPIRSAKIVTKDFQEIFLLVAQNNILIINVSKKD